VRSILILTVFLISALAQAAESYSVLKSDLYPFLDLNEIEQVLYSEGLIPLDSKKNGSLTGPFTDQVFLNPHQIHNQFAAVKLDISFSSQKKILNLADQEFVCHAQTSRKRSFALYVHGYSLSQVQKICNQFLNQRSQFSKMEFLQKIFISPAQAGTDLCLTQPVVMFAVQGLSKALSESEIVSRLGHCLSTALKSATGSVTGLADSLKNSFDQLLKNPTELWSEVKKQVVAVKDFIVHIKEEVTSLKQALTDLDSEMILHLGCQVAGEIIAGMGVGALTGAGMAKLSSRLLQIVLNLRKSKTLLSRLNDLVRGGRSEMAKKVLSCAIQ